MRPKALVIALVPHLLTYSIEAQKGGSGVVIYFRKEGRALGEVTKVNDTWGSHRSSTTYIVIPLQSIMHTATPTPNPHSSGYPTPHLHTRSHPLTPNVPLSFRRRRAKFRLIVSCLQRQETWIGPRIGVFQADGEYCGCEGYAFPGVDARYSSLARYQEDR